MPPDEATARAVYADWDRLNGRYYKRADLRLLDGKVLENVIFDSDSRVVVEMQERPISEQPELFGLEFEVLRFHEQ